MSSDSDPLASVPEGLKPPIEIDPTTQRFDLVSEVATLRHGYKSATGRATVFLDLLPVPDFRFEFSPDQQLSLKDALLNPPLGDAVLEVGPPVGHVNVRVWKTGAVYSGDVGDQISKLDGPVSTAMFLVINGPELHGTAIRRGKAGVAGRMTATADGINVTIDVLSVGKDDKRLPYEATHVVRCEFDPPPALTEVQNVGTDLFRTLSLMKCRWVGLLGPWLYDAAGVDIGFHARVTKTMRRGGALSWCHETIRDAFAKLFPIMYTAFRDTSRADALQTAFHWLIESEQCAGGVEGAIILQQAALECLAWHEIVQQRSLCSDSGFKSLPANDKIRWLLSLNRISAEIPGKSASINAYAKAFNLKDLVDVLVEHRNALVHAEPKKTARLFERDSGDEERTDLWHQIGGILQQALLASLGYTGKMLRRDVDAEYAVGAVRQVPWASA
ncbi:MAG: hypothetical protein AB7U97_13540 [Pirellulales bacterium]